MTWSSSADRRPGEEQHELITAETRNGVGRARQSRKPMGNGCEYAIAGVMAEFVVDRLEMVEIERTDGESTGVARERCERLVKAVINGETVRDAGRPDLQRLARQRAVRFHLSCDIA